MKYIINPQNSNVEGYCYAAGCSSKCGSKCWAQCAALGNECMTFCFTKR
jgi:Cys-rich peptide (Clo7bot family)